MTYVFVLYCQYVNDILLFWFLVFGWLEKRFPVVPQILVVDPHNGGSWECMANMVNEESRPFLCPGSQVLVCKRLT